MVLRMLRLWSMCTDVKTKPRRERDAMDQPRPLPVPGCLPALIVDEASTVDKVVDTIAYLTPVNNRWGLWLCILYLTRHTLTFPALVPVNSRWRLCSLGKNVSCNVDYAVFSANLDGDLKLDVSGDVVGPATDTVVHMKTWYGSRFHPHLYLAPPQKQSCELICIRKWIIN